MHPQARKRLTTTIVALALAFPFLLGLEKIYEADTFWHLKAGEWIVTNWQIPHSDPFAASGQSRAWMDWEWLFQVGIYPVYAVAGFGGLVVVKALLVGLTGLLIFWTCRRTGAGPVLAALIVMLAFVVARGRLEVRPDAVMFLYAATMLAILEADRAGKTKWVWCLPVLQVVWVNTQASFPLGVCLIGAYVIGRFVGAIFNRDRVSANQDALSRNQFVPAAILLLAGVACLINPYGVQLLKHAIEQTGSAGPAGVIGEWQPTRQLLLTEPDWALTVFWWLFWINPVVVVANLIVNWRKFRWEHALIVIGLSVLGLRAHRFTAVYAVVTAPALASGLNSLWQRLCETEFFSRSVPVGLRNVSRFTSTAAVGALAIFLIWAQVTSRWAMAENRAGRFGVGVDRQMVPLRALDKMNALPPELGLFNTFPSGGTLIWKSVPPWRVFTDGRANLYGREFIDQYRAAMRDPEKWETWMRSRDVSVVFLQYSTADDRVLLQHLAHDPEWELYYYDHAACIFVRQLEASRLRLAGRIPPEQLNSPGDAHAVREYARQLADETAPGDAYGRGRVLATMGNFLVAIGENASARPLFEEALQWNPRVSQAWMNLAALALAEKNYDKTMELTASLLQRNPYFYEARLLQAQLKAAKKDLPGAIADVERVLVQAPHSAQGWVVGAQLAVLQNNRSLAIRSLQRAVDEQTEDATVYWFLARLLAGEHRNAEAATAYKQCLRFWVGPTDSKKKIQVELEKLTDSPDH